jgi:outer membrane receptor protein involved in Fe transport
MGQTSSSESLEQKDEAVQLSPFVVSADQDRGYQAANTVAGSRLAVSLKETSAMIGFITKEFMEDIGEVDIAAIGNWGANTYFTGQEDGQLNNVIIRGIPGSFQSLARNYFVTYTPIFPYNIERIEIPRGPNAALYGDAPLGGMVNSNTKRAKLERRFGESSLRLDSEGSILGTLDVNLPLGKKLAGRVNVMKEERHNWSNADIQKNEALHLAGTWAITDKTTFRGELEFTEENRTMPPGTVGFTDQISNWDGTTSYTAPRTSNLSSATGTTGLSNTLDYWVFNSGDPELGLTNWKGFGRSTGRGFAVLPDEELTGDHRPGLVRFPTVADREYNLVPKDTFARVRKGTLMAAYLEHTFFDKLAVDIGYNYQAPEVTRLLGSFNSLSIDVNQVRPDGTSNPHFGEAYADLQYNKDVTKNWVNDTRALMTYPLKWGFMEQRLVGLVGYRSDEFENYRWGLRRVNGPSPLTQNAGNIIVLRRYLSDANTPLGNPDDFGGADVEFRPYQRSKEVKSTLYKQLGMVGRYWNGKVATTLGWRGDDFEHDVSSQNPSVSNVLLTDEPVAIWNSEDPVRNASPDPVQRYPRKFTTNSYTAGAVYFPVKWLGVFANYSEGFTVQGAGPHLYGGPWDPPTNTGVDVGFKLEFFDGKLSGTISRYESERTGVDQQVPSQSTAFKQIWEYVEDGYIAEAAAAATAGNTTLADQLTATAAAKSALNDLIYAGAYDTRTTKANGYELDVVFNPTKNWRGTFNIALPETKLTNAHTEQRAYYSQYAAEWRQRAADSALTNANGINTRLSTIETAFIDNTDGRTTTGTPDYTARFFSTYRIPEGTFKGLRFGGGVQLDGPRVIGTPRRFNAAANAFETPDTLATVKSEAYYQLSVMASYEFKLKGYRIKTQLNINNLLDEDEILFTSVNTYTYTDSAGVAHGEFVRNGYRYLTPRTISLTTSVSF